MYIIVSRLTKIVSLLTFFMRGGTVLSERDIGMQVRMLSNLIRRDMEKSRIRAGIETPNGVHGWAIGYFYENRDKDIFQKDFENKFSIRRSTASNILKLMEKNGFIKRVGVESDARLKKIVLTEKAIQTHNFILEDIKQREERLLKGITPEELEVFYTVVNKFKANLEEENG